MSWLESLINFLNANNGTITAIATVILAYITWRYVRLMKKYVQLTQENVRLTQDILEANNKPELLVFLFPAEGFEYSINLCIQNIGTGFASNVNFTGDLSFEPLYQNLPLKHMGIFKNGIDNLPPGKKIEIPLFHTQKIPQKSLNIAVTYTDSRKNKYTEAFLLEFNKWIGFRQIQSNSFQKIASTLEDIRRKL